MKSLAVSWATCAKKFSRRWLDKTPGERTSAVAWYLGRYAGAGADRAFRTDLDFAEKPRSTNGVQALSTLLMSVETLTVGVLAYILGERRAGMRLIWAYIGLSALPIFAMISIMRLAEPDANRKLVYSFDRGAIMFARRCLSLSLLTVIIVSGSFYARALPGQEPSTYQLFASNAKEHRFEGSYEELKVKKGDVGLEVSVAIRADDFRRMNYPDPLYLEIKLGPEVRGEWQVTEVDGAVDGAPSESVPQLLDEPLTNTKEGGNQLSRASGRFGVIWPHIGKKGTDYTLKVYLHRSEKGRVSVSNMEHFVLDRDDHAFSVNAFYRD